jgi:hypothetical protein
MSKAGKRSGRVTPPKAKHCLFCGSTTKLSYEHVFPKWLRQTGHTGDGWREIIDERSTPTNRIEKGSPFNKKLKVVCAPCNNEWMSELEDDAKPILMEMFNTTGQMVLEAEGQLTLANWAFKTICVLGQLGTGKPQIPPEHPRELCSTGLPPAQCQIWIGTATGQPHPQGVELAQSRIIPREAHVTNDQGTFDFQAYQARFRLFNVFFDAFGSSSPDWNIVQVVEGELSRALLPIWRPTHPKLWWPPAQTIDALGGVDGLAEFPIQGSQG